MLSQKIRLTAPRPGLEPGTCGLTERRSLHLFFSRLVNQLGQRRLVYFPEISRDTPFYGSARRVEIDQGLTTRPAPSDRQARNRVHESPLATRTTVRRWRLTTALLPIAFGRFARRYFERQGEAVVP